MQLVSNSDIRDQHITLVKFAPDDRYLAVVTLQPINIYIVEHNIGKARQKDKVQLLVFISAPSNNTE
jgi:hypothetical protein